MLNLLKWEILSRYLDIPYETNTNHSGHDIWYRVTGWHNKTNQMGVYLGFKVL